MSTFTAFSSPSIDTILAFPLVPKVALKSSSWSVTFTSLNKSAFVTDASVGTSFSFLFSSTADTTGASFVTAIFVLPKWYP